MPPIRVCHVGMFPPRIGETFQPPPVDPQSGAALPQTSFHCPGIGTGNWPLGSAFTGGGLFSFIVSR